MTVRGRLAPSPTGALHLGNVRTFLLAWLSLRAQQGTVVLRIEDLDGPRVKPESTRQLIDDLRWLGFDWDEGPDVGGPCGPYIQSERTVHYLRAFEELRTAGRVYPCVCSRTDIQVAASAPHPGDEGPRYPGTCRGKFVDADDALRQSGRAPAWRVLVPDEELHFIDAFHGPLSMHVQQEVGDFVVYKQSTTSAYQLAVVVDDAAMQITEVVRGADLLSSTPRQILLQQWLGYLSPCYLHLPLVVGPDGRRLAKRHGDTRISSFRDAGIPAELLVGLLAHWSGLSETLEPVMPRDLIEQFDWRAVPANPVVANRESALREMHER